MEKRPLIHVPKIFVVCNQKDTAPIWGYILRQRGLDVSIEASIDNAIDHGFARISDVNILDIDVSHPECARLYKAFLEQGNVPLLLLLPTYHETQVLEAYAAGVDEVVVKPISPPIFLAKIMAWIRRSGSTAPVASMNMIQTGNHRLDPAERCMVNPDGSKVKLTNLEFHLLHLLMSRPGHVFPIDEIVKSIWGGYGSGDQVLLKNVVYRLRKKLEPDPANPVLLQTWSGGYSFQG